MKGVIWLHVVDVAICCCTAPLQPVTIWLTAITKSAVMPLVASAIIAFQSAAARAVGVRPRPARNFALYERTSLVKLAGVMSDAWASQSAGIAAAGVAAIAIAESRSLRASSITAVEIESGGITKFPVDGSI